MIGSVNNEVYFSSRAINEGLISDLVSSEKINIGEIFMSGLKENMEKNLDRINEIENELTNQYHIIDIESERREV